MHVDLTDRTAIVTGAGRGIGSELAVAFAEAGVDVVAAARTEPEIARTVERVQECGSDGLAVVTDLADADDIDRLLSETNDAFGTPTILVNNAAANLANPPLDQTVDEVDTMLGVNLRGLFLLAQAFATGVVESAEPSGRIINISSIVAGLGVPAMTVYGGTKAGVCGITRGLAVDLAPHGITVNSVSPGMTRIERIEQLIEEKGEIYALDRIPAGRLGTPEDVAGACLYLASDAADYVTGIDLRVDGGVTVTAGLYR